MVTDSQAIHDKVKEFILKEFLPGEDPGALTDTTALMTTGILDSLATLKLVTYLEEQFGIQIQAHEADAENLNTLADIVRLVSSKQG
jgi:acyl carrier protein